MYSVAVGGKGPSGDATGVGVGGPANGRPASAGARPLWDIYGFVQGTAERGASHTGLARNSYRSRGLFINTVAKF